MTESAETARQAPVVALLEARRPDELARLLRQRGMEPLSKMGPLAVALAAALQPRPESRLPGISRDEPQMEE
jgi:hypothetical protein